MFHPRLIAVVTALVLLGATGPGRADYSLGQLQAIEGLISSRNCEGLWLFVKSNPGIVDGDDPLANELRVFVTATERGQLDCFASRSTKNAVVVPVPDVSEAVINTQTGALTVNEVATASGSVPSLAAPALAPGLVSSDNAATVPTIAPPTGPAITPPVTVSSPGQTPAVVADEIY